MSTMNREAYQKLVDGDLEWLLRQPADLERYHVAEILRWSPTHTYTRLRGVLRGAALTPDDLREAARDAEELLRVVGPTLRLVSEMLRAMADDMEDYPGKGREELP